MLLPSQAPDFVADVADGMDSEGKKVQGDEDGGKVLLAVTEAVLQVVSLGLENVEGLVLDLPAGAAAGGEFGDILGSKLHWGGDRRVSPARAGMAP